MQLGEWLVNPQLRKEFKKFLDLSLFKKYVKNPRQRLEVLQLGEWYMIWETKNLFDRSTFEDVNLALEDKFVNALLEKNEEKIFERTSKEIIVRVTLKFSQNKKRITSWTLIHSVGKSTVTDQVEKIENWSSAHLYARHFFVHLVSVENEFPTWVFEKL
ncbi:hypothetical protein [Carnobacterium maltaromaticum]|uniref:hypothetical protein n=1 Tax=Carnobacterium maltaromaticum TaxID=2751 RepID=UPI00191B953F|nr:hypothetical protein [Carnobacterium maltaromaticum]CAD5902926.1 hypothetical protein CMALT394_560009 [Carnobacterium maltaromaticum]